MKQPKRSLGLYIHIPFCRSKCIYCDFYSLPGAETYMKSYVAALERHLCEVAERTGGYRVDTVYFGGGTPTLLPEKLLLSLLDTVKKRYDLASDAEITLEANPESARDVKTLKKLRKGGFNRISLGVQAADDELLRAIGRIHTWAEAEAAVAAARQAGFTNLSADLIYGLPRQSMGNWLSTLEKTVALGLEHISCYGLKVEEGTPLCEKQASYDLPDDDAQADMYLACVETLSQHGFAQYEISNFARPGYASRHNLRYWQLREYAGFGPGAHSDLGGVRYAYARSLEDYMAGVADGTLRVSEAETLSPWERSLEYIMLSLRTAAGISRREFERVHRGRFDVLEAELKKLSETGLAAPTEEGWRLTPRGFLVSNSIISRLWEIHSQTWQHP